ncbi:hypothetical protein ILYODFUR_033607, partial [Ilyodon furcidens]
SLVGGGEECGLWACLSHSHLLTVPGWRFLRQLEWCLLNLQLRCLGRLYHMGGSTHHICPFTPTVKMPLDQVRQMKNS